MINHLHSVNRYVVLALLIFAVIRMFNGWMAKKPFTASDNRISLFAFIACHLQLLFGLVLYAVSPIIEVAFSDVGSAMQDPQVRFYFVEHSLLMIIAIALITVGRISAKKMATDELKFKRTAIFFGIGLLLILAMIPWPFLKDFGTWM